MDQPSPRSVLFVTPRWRRDGGIAAHAEASAAALADAGLQVTVLAEQVPGAGTADAARGSRATAVEILHAQALTNRGAPIDQRLKPVLAQDGPPDVVHLHQVDDPDVVAALRKLAPVVISAHGFTACTSDVYYFRPGQKCTRAHGPGCIPNLAFRGCAHTPDPRPLVGAYRRTTRAVRALELADLAVAYGTAVDEHLAANEIEPRRVIPLFTTLPAPGAARRHGQGRRVLFAGRVVPPKGLDVLVRAISEVEAELVVCGEGWQLDRVQRLARRLGVEQRLQLRGWLGPEELATELAQADLLALPSVWPEPFGLVGIEALAAGVPVVASATGGIPDWLDDGVSGLLTPPGNAPALARAMNELLADPARRQAMGEAGRAAVAARFSPERHVEAILEAYRGARAAWERGGAATAA